MKLLKRRAAALLFLILLMVFGMFVFTSEYVKKGPTWVQHYSNKHLYAEGKALASGTIYDRNGEVWNYTEKILPPNLNLDNSFGIGLALSKSIVEKQDGFISVDSKVGVGTVFTIKYFRR